jgi:uncharacterized ferritin-like protein (DUF455 family)
MQSISADASATGANAGASISLLTMEISELAERVLFGNSIEDKLAPMGAFADHRPGPPVQAPTRPGRPPALDLDRAATGSRVRFSDLRRLDSDKERGLVLHFFCNHELLALELMALALLKFPDAPPRFRRGLAHTLADEQRHVQLYLERMARIGISFGDIPVSDFFWRSIAPMSSPLDFVTRLSLTLEQANLDYAIHYAAVYRRLGDTATATILEQVYRDEISHVRHGLVWFDRWRDPNLSQWEGYCDVLAEPLSPGRAKGIGFNRQGRRRAGLSDDFIDQLEVFAVPRKNCPALYWFNPAAEFHLAPGRSGQTPPASAQRLADDLACLPMYFCRPGEALAVPQRPGTAHLRRLQELGFPLPEFIQGQPQSTLEGRRVTAVRPWAQSPDSAEYLQGLNPHEPLWRDTWRPLYTKDSDTHLLHRLLKTSDAKDRVWLCGEDCIGQYCTTAAQVEATLTTIWDQGWDQAVAKGNFGAAGLDQLRLRPGPSPSAQHKTLMRLLDVHGGVVVEPWLQRVADFSAQYDVRAGQAETVGWTRFLTDGRGRFRGALVTQPTAGLSQGQRRFLYGDGHDPHRLERTFTRAANLAAAEAGTVDYNGPLGIDAMLYRLDGNLRFKPVVETNPRHTMGRVALQLRRRVNSARMALWLLLGPADLAAAGCASFAALAAQWHQTHPVDTLDGQICSGALFTNDPQQAHSFAGVLLVGSDLESCTAMLPEKIGAGLHPALFSS